MKDKINSIACSFGELSSQCEEVAESYNTFSSSMIACLIILGVGVFLVLLLFVLKRKGRISRIK